LRMLNGDERGHEELQGLLAEFERLTGQDVINPFAHYWAATASALLEREKQASALLTRARSLGWHHDWWKRLDWNAQSLA